MTCIIINDVLLPKGGPPGYLYNLKESLEENNIQNIKIFSKNINKSIFFNLIIDKLKLYLKQFIKVKRKNYLQKNNEISFYKNLLTKHYTEITNSSILHFHTTYDLYNFSKVYDIKKHTVLLMSHSPEPAYLEVYKKCLDLGNSKMEAHDKAEIRRKMDIKAFKIANYLIFPCEGAISPYRKFFNQYQIDTSKLKYIITSSKPLVAKLTSEEFKNKYKISNYKKIISYVGRKNKIKGFDIFCEIAKTLENDDRFFFISAGIGDIKTPIQDNFLDIGWTDDPGSVVHASDVQIVPNRNTYFDLGIVQALSLNTSIITTNTGGNNWFLGKDINMFFGDCNNVTTFIDLINDKKVYAKNTKNRDFYNSNLNNEIFARNYDVLYKEIENI